MVHVSINGRITSEESATVSIFDSGFYFGLGIYETILVRNRVPLFYREHFERLTKAIKFLQFPRPAGLRSRIMGDSKTLIQQCRTNGEYKMRIMLTPGQVMFPGVHFEHLNEVIILSPMAEKKPDNFTMYVSKLTKQTDFAVPSYVKLTSNHKNLLSARNAHKAGANEALLLNQHGKITEGSFSNFFFIKDGNVYTPSEENNLLAGITRKKVLDICKREKIGIKIGCYSFLDVKEADEVFITSSTRGIVPVDTIIFTTKSRKNKAIHFQPQSLIKVLSAAYERDIQREISKNKKRWL